MNKIFSQALILVVGLVVSITATAEGDAARGKALFTVCAACHGPTGAGNAMLNAPVNAGQEQWYVARQLKNFRSGVRGTHPKDAFGMQMRPMAMSLADDQAVEDVAAYVAAMTPTTPEATIEGDAAAGKAGYMVCMACHGADGKGNQAMNAPGLLNQYDWYLVRQIKNFKEGIRGGDASDVFGMQMKPMANLLATDKQVNDVVAYIMSLN